MQDVLYTYTVKLFLPEKQIKISFPSIVNLCKST